MGYGISIVDKSTNEALLLSDKAWQRKSSNLNKIDDFGSNICIGGTECLSTSITYNYGGIYRTYMHKNLGLKYLNGKDILSVMNIICNTSKEMLKDYVDWNKYDIKHNEELKSSKYWYKNIKSGENPSIVYHESDLWNENNYWTPTIANAHKAMMHIYKLCSIVLDLCKSDPENYIIKMD